MKYFQLATVVTRTSCSRASCRSSRVWRRSWPVSVSLPQSSQVKRRQSIIWVLPDKEKTGRETSDRKYHTPYFFLAFPEEDPPLESERCSPMLASQATEHIPGPSSIPTQAPPAVMAPPPMAPQPRLSTLTTARPAQDYAVASMLVDYRLVGRAGGMQGASVFSQLLLFCPG